MAISYTRDVLTFDGSNLPSTVYTYQAFPLEQYREEDGLGYRFVKFLNGTGDIAAVAGKLCYAQAASGNVTSDESDQVGAAYGAFVSAPADTNHCWVQVWGRITLKTDGTDNIVKGDTLVALVGGADGVVTRLTLTTVDPTLAQMQAAAKTVGDALADDDNGADTVAAFLRLG
jgi:hypothetical protein